eukprot:COSAG03_NODE_6253_length_1089_cov_2.129293_2_plen_68_part_00
MSEWARQPLLGYRILQDPGAYADTLALPRGERTTARNVMTTLHEDRAPFGRARLLQAARLQCCSAAP